MKPKGSVTLWLKNLEMQMRKSVAKAVKTAIDEYGKYQTRNQWILANYAQTLIAASQVFWCNYCTEAIDGNYELSEKGLGRLKGEASVFQNPGAERQNDPKGKTVTPLQLYYSKFENDLQSMIQLIKSNLTKLQRCAITALATIETHSRDTIQILIDKKLTSTTDFEFQKLQRYYYRPMDPETPIYIM